MKDLNKVYVVLLNGPAGSGKDHIADVLVKRLGVNKEMFKKQLYIDTAERFNVDVDWFKAVANDRIRKEIPMDELEGYSPRGALIQRSENEIKPEKGLDYYGRLTFNELVEGINVISDSGFKDEAIGCTLTSGIPAKNVFHVKVYRNGFEFSSNDSRNYFSLVDEGVPTATFVNNSAVGGDLSDELIVKNFILVFRMLKWN